jgi:hypothetical protein
MLQNRKIERHETVESPTETPIQRNDISLSKIKEILTNCHIETDKKLEELVNKCVKKNEQQKA